MDNIEIIATDKLGVKLCQTLKQLGRGLRAFPPLVTALGSLFEQEGAEKIPKTGIWSYRFVVML